MSYNCTLPEFKMADAKFIFLDMDGVIAIPSGVKNGSWLPTKEPLEQLKRILDATGAYLVISSSWRYPTVDETIKSFEEKGFPFCDKIVGVTPRDSRVRGQEIDYWRRRNGRVYWFQEGFQPYIILDDDCDMLIGQLPYFIKCNYIDGLTSDLADVAINILNGVKQNTVCSNVYRGFTVEWKDLDSDKILEEHNRKLSLIFDGNN